MTLSFLHKPFDRLSLNTSAFETSPLKVPKVFHLRPYTEGTGCGNNPKTFDSRHAVTDNIGQSFKCFLKISDC